MNNLFRLLIALFAINLCTIKFCFSQKITVQGKVSDITTGEGLPGVNVYVESSPIGTITDMHGLYKLEIDKGTYTITYSFLGYDTRKEGVTLHDNVKKDIGLSPANMELEEVVVTSQRKFFGNMEFGRELPSIGIAEIAMQNVNMASDVLHAKLPGVWATKTSGAPGDHQKIRIRGQTSFFASAEPLYVIDGVPVPIVNLSSLGISHLNVHDIENITVLRDASSASLYGYQGGNGVVLIDTKKGGGENQISFLTRIGYQQIPHFYDLHNSAELIEVLDSARSILGSNVRSAYPNITDTLCSRDWQREIFTTGRLQEYQLSGAGKLGKTNFYISGNYTDHTGIVKTSAYERYTGFARLGRTFFGKLAVNIGYRTTKEENRNNIDAYRGNDLILDGVSESPCIECTPYGVLRDTTSFGDSYKHRTFFQAYEHLYNDYQLPNQPALTPNDFRRENNTKIKTTSQSIDLALRAKINDSFSINLMESVFIRKSVYNPTLVFKLFKDNYKYSKGNLMLNSHENVFLANHQLSVNYQKWFNKHNINLVAAHRAYIDNLWWNVDTIVGGIPDHYSLKNSMAAYGQTGSVVRKIQSYLGHASYSFNNKYFASFIGHLSHLKEGLHTDYYTFFPSLAIGWDISREYLLNNLNWLDEFKLYFNTGIAGNYPLNGFANDLYKVLEYTPGGNPGMFPAIQQFANHFLEHERTYESDYGIKLRLWNGRLNMQTAYFVKKIENMLLLRDIPYYFGAGKMYLNLGKISVKGYEIGFDATPVLGKNFQWLVSFNYYTSKQKVMELDRVQDLLFKDNDLLIPDFLIKEGQNIGDIYGYKFLGKGSKNELSDLQTAIVQGDKYLNIDKRVGLHETDKVLIGNSVPKHNLNLQTNLYYKSLELDMVWYAVLGYDKYNATRAAAVMTGLAKESAHFVNDTLQSLRSYAFYESDIFVEDAGFIRLKRITLAYSPSLAFWSLSPKISLSFENMITITKYKGYDPEATIFTDNNFSDNGIDRGAYPSPKAVYIGIQLKF